MVTTLLQIMTTSRAHVEGVSDGMMVMEHGIINHNTVNYNSSTTVHNN